MAGFANRYRVRKITLTHDDIPTWQPGSSWTFRAEKCDDDDEAVQSLVTRVIVTRELSRDEIRDALRRGEDVNELVAASLKREYVMSTKRALLLHMSAAPDPLPGEDTQEHAWIGPDFTLPADFEVADGTLHECAGQVPPVTAEWIAARTETDELDTILRRLYAVWAGRSAQAEDAFRGGAERVE